MKKLLSFILLICLFIPCSFMLTACGEDDTNDVISLKILLNGEELTSYECDWDNIDGNNEIINKEDITILKVYEDTTEVPVYVRDCSVKFNNGTNNISSLDFWESGETELTQPGTYNITISNGGVSANFEIKINKMNRTYGDVSLINGTDTLGYGGFDNTYTIDWNYNQYKNLSLGGICESEPYGEDKAITTHYFVDKTGYDNAEDKSIYYQTNKTECYADFTTMPIGNYYIFAEFSETAYYKAGISTSPLCLTLNARNFEPAKTTLDVEFDVNNLISSNKLVENAESINIKYGNIEEKINALFPQFEDYGITAFEKLSYYVYENNTWKEIESTSSDIKVNAINIGDVYYLVEYDFENQKWLRVSTSAEVDENYIEVVNYSQLQDYQVNKYVQIPLYCKFNSQNLNNDFYYCTNVDKIFTLNLTIKKAQINSIYGDLGTFTIQNLGYDVKPDIINAIDKLMIANNNENVKYLYTYPNCLDGITPGSYNTTVLLINNPNICWNMVRNFNFNVANKDTVNPIITIENYNTYDRDIYVDFAKMINMSLLFDYDTNKLTIEIIENGTTVKTFIYQLSFVDKETQNGAYTVLDNKTFEYEVIGENIIGSSDYFAIKDVGATRINLTINDSFNNKDTTGIKFAFYNSNTNLELDYYELDFTTPIAHETENNEDGTDKIIGYKKNSLPAKMAISNAKVELPVAYAKISGKELTVVDGNVSNETATIKVTKNSAPQVLNAEGSIFTSKDGKYYIAPSEAGVYVVEYSYSDSANRPTKTFTISVEENYEMSDLKLAAQPIMPSVELGKTEVKLPNISVNAGDEKSVDVNVDSIVISKDNDSSIKQVLENNNFKFDMTPEAFEGVDNYADMVGNYKVTYNVSYNGKTLTETFYINGVTVSSKPSIKLSYNYEVEGKSVSEIKEVVKLNAETELKAEYLSSSEMLMPAVYVEDAVTTKFGDFVVERVLRKGSNYYYIDNAKYDEDANDGKGGLVPVTSEDAGYNASGDTNIGQFNKAVKFKFSDKADNIEGTYYLEYRVYTNSIKDRNNILTMSGTSDKYTFKVVSTHSETVPTISITNLKNKTVKNTEEITVNVNSSDELDSRIKNVVYTYSSKKAEATASFEYYLTAAIELVQSTAGYEKTVNILEDERVTTEMLKYFNDFALVEEDEDKKDNFKLDLSEKSGDVYVVAVAINDNGKIGIDTRILTVENANDDISPIIDVYYDELPEQWKDSNEIDGIKTNLIVKQGEIVYLPTCYAIDNNDTTLSTNILYYIDSPNNKFNTTNKNFYYTTIEIDGQNKEVQMLNGGYITTTESGRYYILYSAVDSGDNKTIKYFTFEVVDSSKPVLYVEPVGNDISLAGNTISANKGAIIDFEITLKSSDGKEDLTSDENISIKVSTEGKAISYSPSGEGRYSYKFNDYGTYVITISGQTSIEIGGVSEDIEAETKTIKVVIAKEEIKWLGEFDIPEYGIQNQDFEIKDVAASNGAEVEVTYLTPSTAEKDAKKAIKKTDANGYIYWVIPAEDTKTKGTYTIIYTATNNEDKLVQKKEVKFGDNVAPTLSFTAGPITKDIVYAGEDIEIVVKQDNSKKEFTVTAYNNGEELYSHNIALTIKDKTDAGDVTSNVSWSRLSFDVTGSNVTAGETKTESSVTTKQYFIKGTGSYSLKLTAEDSYKNSKTEKIYFNVVEKLEQDEEEIEEIKSYESYIVSTNGTGEFNIEDLNIMPGTHLEYTLINSCKIDGIQCETTSNISMTNNVIKLTNGDNSAYVILKVTKLGNAIYKDYSQYIQIKIYR